MTNTQAVIIAIGIAVAGIAYAQAQGQTIPNTLPGCVYNTTPPTLANGQQTVLQCDVNGRLKVTTS